MGKVIVLWPILGKNSLSISVILIISLIKKLCFHFAGKQGIVVVPLHYYFDNIEQVATTVIIQAIDNTSSFNGGLLIDGDFEKQK